MSKSLYVHICTFYVCMQLCQLVCLVVQHTRLFCLDHAVIQVNLGKSHQSGLLKSKVKESLVLLMFLSVIPIQSIKDVFIPMLVCRATPQASKALKFVAKIISDDVSVTECHCICHDYMNPATQVFICSVCVCIYICNNCRSTPYTQDNFSTVVA